MLSQLRIHSNQVDSNSIQFKVPVPDDRWGRDQKEDLKTAIDLLFKFKEGLEKLHPEVLSIIEKMISVNSVNRY